MTIHHDKLLYGKLESLQSEFSEEQLLAMAGALQKSETLQKADETPQNTAQNTAQKTPQKTPQKSATAKKNKKNK